MQFSFKTTAGLKTKMQPPLLFLLSVLIWSISVSHQTLFATLGSSQVYLTDLAKLIRISEDKCGTKMTCEHKNSAENRCGCSCDMLCNYRHDCCLDVTNQTMMADQTGNYSCKAPDVDGQLHHVIDRCVPESSAHYHHSCETDVTFISNLWVTNRDTGRTYKNFICAICNGESDEDLQPWSPVCNSQCDPLSIESMIELQPTNLPNGGIEWAALRYQIPTPGPNNGFVNRAIRSSGMDPFTTISPGAESSTTERTNLCQLLNNMPSGPLGGFGTIVPSSDDIGGFGPGGGGFFITNPTANSNGGFGPIDPTSSSNGGPEDGFGGGGGFFIADPTANSNDGFGTTPSQETTSVVGGDDLSTQSDVFPGLESNRGLPGNGGWFEGGGTSANGNDGFGTLTTEENNVDVNNEPTSTPSDAGIGFGFPQPRTTDTETTPVSPLTTQASGFGQAEQGTNENGVEELGVQNGAGGVGDMNAVNQGGGFGNPNNDDQNGVGSNGGGWATLPSVFSMGTFPTNQFGNGQTNTVIETNFSNFGGSLHNFINQFSLQNPVTCNLTLVPPPEARKISAICSATRFVSTCDARLNGTLADFELIALACRELNSPFVPEQAEESLVVYKNVFCFICSDTSAIDETTNEDRIGTGVQDALGIGSDASVSHGDILTWLILVLCITIIDLEV